MNWNDLIVFEQGTIGEILNEQRHEAQTLLGARLPSPEDFDKLCSYSGLQVQEIALGAGVPSEDVYRFRRERPLSAAAWFKLRRLFLEHFRAFGQ